MKTEQRINWPIRQLSLVGAFVLGIGLIAGVGHQHYPIQHWLFWRYASYWVYSLLFLAASLSFGHFVLRRLYGPPRRIYEHLTLSFGLGFFFFEVLSYLAGSLQLYHYKSATFFLIPSLMITIGGRSFGRFLRQTRRHQSRQARAAAPLPLWTLVILGFGCLGLLMVYFPVLSPKNAQFDTLWKHLAIAEDYVASGGLRRFPEGWTPSTRPHMTSFLFAWAFMMPSELLFDRVELCAHLEFTVFAWTTIVGIPAVVRRLVSRADARWIWAARFLFPGIFLYDSNLSLGADHFGALYGPPIFLALSHAWKRLDLRSCALLGALTGAAAIVKYTSMLLLVVIPACTLLGRALWLLIAQIRGANRNLIDGRAFRGPLTALVFGVIATSPHWLKNMIFHGDPMYPMLHDFFASRPWTAGAQYMFEWGYKDAGMWRPARTLAGVWETVCALATFSFVPNNWQRFHGMTPVFGSLFTLSLLYLPFLKKTKRIWALVAWIHGGLFLWYWTHHQDRYLQGLVPLMTAALIATLLLAWRASGRIARTALVSLVLLQIIWGGDTYFFQTHAMSRAPIKVVNDLLQGGFKKQYEERFAFQAHFTALSEHIPAEGSRVLLHNITVHLGINRPTVSDRIIWQHGINYGQAGSPAKVFDILNEMKVTHVVWPAKRSKYFDTLAGDIIFYSFAKRHLRKKKKVGRFWVGQMPLTRPTEGDFHQRKVAILACKKKPYTSGLYSLEQLQKQAFGPDLQRRVTPRLSSKSRKAAEALISNAHFVVAERKCFKALPRSQMPYFESLMRNRKFRRVPRADLYIRRLSVTPPRPIQPQGLQQ